MLDNIITKYIQLRDHKKVLKDEFTAKTADIDKAMERIEAHLLAKMQESGLESLPTDAGTAYKSVRSSATVADKNLFRQWVLDNDAWELADLRAAPVAIKAYREEKEDLPPGINFSQHLVVGVRRS